MICHAPFPGQKVECQGHMDYIKFSLCLLLYMALWLCACLTNSGRISQKSHPWCHEVSHDGLRTVLTGIDSQNAWGLLQVGSPKAKGLHVLFIFAWRHCNNKNWQISKSWYIMTFIISPSGCILQLEGNYGAWNKSHFWCCFHCYVTRRPLMIGNGFSQCSSSSLC